LARNWNGFYRPFVPKRDVMAHENKSDQARPSFDELVDLTRCVTAGFDERERRPWGIEATVIELVKQVGDLPSARALLLRSHRAFARVEPLRRRRAARHGVQRVGQARRLDGFVVISKL
jgi:hypothetical protein